MERKPHQAGETIQRILTAARDAFSEAGFSATTMDGIARRAGVNKATLYYHIGDKETLYAEMIRGVIEQNVDGLALDLLQARTPEEKLRRYVRKMAAAVDENPWMPRIMMRELAAGGTHLSDVAVRAFTRVLVLLGEILAEGVRKGVFVETSPFLLHMMLMGAYAFYKTSATLRARSAELFPDPPKGDARVSGPVAAEVERLILRAVMQP
jgi:AcrR family transcriptional regulator